MKRILVVGAGQMGSGIAQVAAQTGFQVTVLDSFAASLEKSKTGIEKSLAKLFEKKIISESPSEILARIVYSEKMIASELLDVSLAIEAATENVAIKEKIFRELDEKLPASAILASNTSSISITKIAGFTKRPSQVTGMHFMNPVPIMKLVELIEGQQTSTEVSKVVRATAEKMGKICIVSKDKSGFVINRVLMPMINEAFFVLEEGTASAEDIDLGMKLGTNQPMGPLALADLIGLDTCLSIIEVMYQDFRDEKYKPCALLRKYVESGRMGKKSGHGVYQY